jgi:uncharacterized sulfatase
MRMIRTPEWKFVRHFEASGADELYDLTADPHESHNLAASSSHRDRRDDLARRLDRWMASIGDPLAGTAANP